MRASTTPGVDTQSIGTQGVDAQSINAQYDQDQAGYQADDPGVPVP